MDFIYLAALALFVGLIAAFAKACAKLAGDKS